MSFRDEAREREGGGKRGGREEEREGGEGRRKRERETK